MANPNQQRNEEVIQRGGGSEQARFEKWLEERNKDYDQELDMEDNPSP